MALLGALPVAAQVPAPDNTWTQLAPLPERLDSPVFALAVNPADNQQLLVGTGTGNLYRSTDGGASWKLARSVSGRAVVSLAYNPFKPSTVLAGTRGGGAWSSSDGGANWLQMQGTETRTVRSFGFTRGATAAGSDQGVLIGRDGGAPWKGMGLTQVNVGALAIAGPADPARLVAGGDGSRGPEPLPLFASGDGGQSWSPVAAAAGSTMVSTLAAGPPPPKQEQRPLLMGTNAGLFASADSGASWAQVTGGGLLPATDFTAVAWTASHGDRFYVASDGGGGDKAGLWATADSGLHFTSLKPPEAAVTALAVSGDETPSLFTASFRPADHAVLLWGYRDAGGAAQPPAAGVAPVPQAAAPGAATARRAAFRNWPVLLLTGPEAPYLALGAGAILVLLVAMAAYVRRGRGF